jgi:nucleoside-diphosphate-sugar epimerase
VTTVAPDVVIHQLTDLSGADGEATNRLRRQGTRNLVDAAKAAGVHRIIAQSISWVYVPGESPADETVQLDAGAEEPRGGMVEGIRALEDTAAELDTAVLLRYGILYGPGTWYAPGGAAAAGLAGQHRGRRAGRGARVGAGSGSRPGPAGPGSPIGTAELGTGSVQRPGPVSRLAARLPDLANGLRQLTGLTGA